MAFWSGFFGNDERRYHPWSGEFCRKLEARQAALLSSPPLRGFEAPAGFSAVERRDGLHHSWFTLRKPKEEGVLLMLKTARAGRGPAAVQRLMEEVSLLVGLSTSHHLPPLDVLNGPDIEGGRGVTYFYCGGDLEQRVAAGTVPAAEVAHYGLQLAAELVDIHEAGLLHLAIAPASVFFERVPKDSDLCRWRLLLANFDLRGVRQGEPAVPRVEPDGFCAPEQLAGAPVDIRTDLWGLGATLYFLCAGQPPAVPSLGTEPCLDALVGQYPDWLVAVIGSCLALAPERRPPSAAALFDALLTCVRIESDVKGKGRAANGHAGPAESTAKAVVADRYLLACANRLNRVEGGRASTMIDLGPATRFKEADRLFKAGTVSSLRRAVAVLDDVFGSWSDPAAPLAQFAAKPQGPSFIPLRRPEKWVGKECWATISSPIPIGVLWAMLDLQCRCYVALIEAEGRREDVERALRLCENWLKKGTCGTPSSAPPSPTTFPASKCLTHVAQCLRYAGLFEKAKRAISMALDEEPAGFEVLFTAFMVGRDDADYEAATSLMDQIAEAAMAAHNLQVYAQIFVLGADLAFRMGDYATATQRYAVLMEKIPSPELENLSRQVRCRVQGKATAADLESALKVAEPAFKLEQWFAAADLAVLAGETQTAKQLIERIRKEPRFRLAPDWWYHRELKKLEARMDAAASSGAVDGGAGASATVTPAAAPSTPSASSPSRPTRAGELTDREMFEEVHYHRETGLWSDYAFRQIQELTPKKWTLAINLGFLVDDEASDALGQDVANEGVWLLGAVLQRNRGAETEAALPYPDQLTACSDDREHLEDLAEGIKAVAEKVAFYVARANGGGAIQQGFGFKYAIGADYQEADGAATRAGKRGVLTLCPASQLSEALEAARDAGFLLLDGAALESERRQRRATQSTGPGTPISHPGTEPAAQPGRAGGVPAWPADARSTLEAAARTGTYFETALRLMSRAAAQAIASHRARRARG